MATTIEIKKLPDYILNNHPGLLEGLDEDDVLSLSPQHVPPAKIEIKVMADFYSFLRVCEYFSLETMPLRMFEALVDLRAHLKKEEIEAATAFFRKMCLCVMEKEHPAAWVGEIIKTGPHGNFHILGYLLEQEKKRVFPTEEAHKETFTMYTSWRNTRCQAMIVGVQTSNKKAMEWADNENVCKISAFMAFAAQKGHVTEMEWLHQRGYPICRQSMMGAICGKHNGALTWLLDHGQPCDDLSLCGVTGNMWAMQEFRKRGCPWHWSVLHSIINGKRLHGESHPGARREMFSWAVEHGCPLNRKVHLCAIKNNDNEILDLVLDNTTPPLVPLELKFLYRALKHDNAHAVKALMDHDCPIHPNVCRLAAALGKVGPLRAFLDHPRAIPPIVVTPLAVKGAAKGGHLECLQVMFSEETKFAFCAPGVLSNATLSDQPDVLTFLFDCGCVAEGAATATAIQQGKLRSLQTIVQRTGGTDITPWRCTLYGAFKHFPIVEFLFNNGFMEEWTVSQKKAFLGKAITARKTKCVQFLREKGGFHLLKKSFDEVVKYVRELEAKLAELAEE